jgi:hypothetical protein
MIGMFAFYRPEDGSFTTTQANETETTHHFRFTFISIAGSQPHQ